MRVLTPAAVAVLASAEAAIVQLVTLGFSPTPIQLNSSNWNLKWQHLVNLLRESGNYASPVWSSGPPAINLVLLTGQTLYTGAVGSCYKLNESTALSPQNIFQQVDIAAGRHVLSHIVHEAERNLCLVSLGDSGLVNGAYAYFNISTGAVVGSPVILGSASDPVAQIQPLGFGWYRVSVSCVFAAPASVFPALWVRQFPGGNYVGTAGQGIRVHGSQLEPAQDASDYTATGASGINQPGDYKGAYGLGTVSAITDRPGEVQGITLELAGGDSARIALALDDADIIQGTPVTIRTAILSMADYKIVDAPIDFVGTLDTMSIAEDGQQCSIRVTAESRAVDLLRGVPQFYNDADQRAIDAADGSMKYVVDQIDKPVVWPSREALQR